MAYLNLSSLPAFDSVRNLFIPPDLFGDLPHAAGEAQKTIVSLSAQDLNTINSIFAPNVPREDRVETPTETDLALAVREQLQALGIYARSLFLEEKLARAQHKAVYVAVPAREHPAESEYLVADARVENQAVRAVIKNALEAGLIGDGKGKLDQVAIALTNSYGAYEAAAAAGEKTTVVKVAEYRDWLVANSSGADAKVVLDYIKTLRTTLTKIRLLGLTDQELEGSKAQIYGSVLRGRLNVEPEFLRALVEKTPENIFEVKNLTGAKKHQQAGISPVESRTGRALY